MTGFVASPPTESSLLSRAIGRVKSSVSGLPERHRRNRYIRGGVISVVVVWTLCAAYLLFMPRSFVSKGALILPGAGANVSVSLDKIGQTSSVAASPFSSASLSPKVVYREILLSDPVLSAAAEAVGMKLKEFGEPNIKLIDEASVILLEVKGRTAEMAQKKAVALVDAFENKLDVLRRDEIERRDASVRDTMKSYQANLQAARQRISDLQQKTGLVSVEQFNEFATQLEAARKKLAETRAEADRLDATQKALTATLGMSPKLASTALSLSADSVFAKSLTDYADLTAQVEQFSGLYGARNPLLIQIRAKQSAAYQMVKSMARRAGVSPNDLSRLLAPLVQKRQEELLKELVSGAAAAQGKQREVIALQREVDALDQRIKNLTLNAARMEDLKKDHLVAEAVFSSALARVDTNKADLFASYPIAQVLAPPNLPKRPSQPRLLYAILGGLVGTLLAGAAWTLAWLRQSFVQKLAKRA
ncbi:GumC family protein [Methylocystis bryophila]|uniref:GumC family protein n=1 Tax=Methylocystis bryophila TaxID=655015 RepID=UPI00131A35E1|nr:hypothetical protein [Methylocystis bryophila]BDV38194.1 hypothetical protein DSM21852_14470 [Methylocystis bryophila]